MTIGIAPKSPLTTTAFAEDEPVYTPFRSRTSKKLLQMVTVLRSACFELTCILSNWLDGLNSSSTCAGSTGSGSQETGQVILYIRANSPHKSIDDVRVPEQPRLQMVKPPGAEPTSTVIVLPA